MASHQVLEQLGLMAADNEVTLPKGALVEASNVVIRANGVIEPRRGEKYVGQSLGTPAAQTFGAGADRSKAGGFFGSTPVHHYGSKLSKYAGGAFADFTGTFTAPDAAQQRMKFVEFAESLLVTTSLGPYILDAITGTPEAVGVPRAWDFHREEVALDGNPGAGWMSTDCAVAYRVVWAKKDANDRVKTGYPSGRTVVHNVPDITAAVGTITIIGNGYVLVGAEGHGLQVGDTVTVSPGETGLAAGTYAVDGTNGITADSFYLHPGGAPPAGSNTLEQTLSSGLKSVALRVRIPPIISEDHFFQVFRSHESATMLTAPDDELYLVYESDVDAADILAGYVDFVDSTPESLLDLGQPLYTNPNTGDGIAAANDLPPLCKDLFAWDDRLFAVNTTDYHRFELQLLGVGSPDGVQNGDSITIGGGGADVTFTAHTGGGGDFLVHSIDSVEKNIERTALNLVEAINADEDCVCWAYYVSEVGEVPGKVLLIGRTLGAAAFPVYASRPESWNPPLLSVETGAATSTNSRRKNGFSYSKKYEPDHWPALNYDVAGASNWELLRGIGLGDKAYLFPEVGGVFALSGQAPYTVKNVDESACLIAPDTVVKHNNQIYALTTQGFVSIGDGGVRILSGPIKDELDSAVATLGTVLARYAFAVSYEAERQVHLWLPTGLSDTSAKVCHIYDSLNGTWSRRDGDRTWGAVHPTERKLYLGDGTKDSLRVERKDFARTDYADESLPVTVSFYSAPVVTLADASGVTVGDVLWQSASKVSLITAKSGNDVTVTTPAVPFTVGAAQVEVAFTATARYACAAPGGPDALKKFVDLVLHFRRIFLKVLSILFTSEIGTTEKSRSYGRTDYTTAAQTLAQLTAEPGPKNVPVEVPREQSECTQLRVGVSVREAWAVWALNGHTLQYEQISQTKGAR